MKPSIVIRSHNDMPMIAETLAAIHRQDFPFELIVFDNESTDGTLDAIKKYTARIVNIPRGTYVPGRVLNLAMEVTEGQFVVFLNSDCTPCDESWLRNLLKGFTEEAVAAVFGRQVPRPGCAPLYAKDTEDTFGDGSGQRLWRHCFSMASSAIRRSVWENIRFNEGLKISEDVDWTWRARQRGFTIRYVPDSVVLHSHNYSLRQYARRQYLEGRDEALIFEWPRWQRSLLRYSLLPWGRRMLSDWRHCLGRLAFGPAFWSPILRTVQMVSRRAGFRAGLREVSR